MVALSNSARSDTTRTEKGTPKARNNGQDHGNARDNYNEARHRHGYQQEQGRDNDQHHTKFDRYNANRDYGQRSDGRGNNQQQSNDRDDDRYNSGRQQNQSSGSDDYDQNRGQRSQSSRFQWENQEDDFDRNSNRSQRDW